MNEENKKKLLKAYQRLLRYSIFCTIAFFVVSMLRLILAFVNQELFPQKIWIEYEDYPYFFSH